MKTKINLMYVFVMLACSVFGQTVKKEFYDFQKTKLMAEYQVNAAGEKNGWFKGYDQKGVIVYEYNYKSNQFNGLNKEYTTVNGKREIMKSETYKDGTLDGPATYYGENGLVLKQGNYKNGNRDGKWLMLDPYNNYNIKNKDELKGCEFVKSEVTYANGEPTMEGKVTVTYYPSGKIRSEQEYSQGKKVGEHKWYYPNGKPEGYYKYDGTTEKYLIKKTYYTNGQLWEDFNWTGAKPVLLDYYEDGSPGILSKQNMEAQKEINAANRADSAFNASNFELGLSICKEFKIDAEALSNLCTLEKSFNSGNKNASDAKYRLSDIEKSRAYRDASELQKKLATKKIEILKNKITEVIQLDENIKNKWKDFTSAYAVPINNGSALSYPKGEHIYIKSRLVIDELFGEYNKAVTPDDKLKTGNAIITSLDKMIAHSTSDQCKDLNKQLKKVEDKAQVKTILGL